LTLFSFLIHKFIGSYFDIDFLEYIDVLQLIMMENLVYMKTVFFLI